MSKMIGKQFAFVLASVFFLLAQGVFVCLFLFREESFFLSFFR